VAIEGIIGLPGAGKTFYAVRKLYRLRRFKPDRAIYANLPVYLPGEPVRLIETLPECYGLAHCHILLDEIHGLIPAADWAGLGKDVEFRAWVTQLRKRDVDVWYTTQHVSLVAKHFRELTMWSWYLESWRRLFGLFSVTGYALAVDEPRRRFYRGWFLFNERLARLYDTDYLMKF
jgi:hypothetical protein